MTPEMEFLISRYNDPDLTARECENLRALLADDPAARELLDDYQRLDGELARLPALGEAANLAQFFRRVAQALDRTRMERRSSALVLRRLAIPLAAAASLLLALGLAFWFANTRPATDGRNFVSWELQSPSAPAGSASVQLAQNDTSADSEIIHVAVAGSEDPAYAFAGSLAERPAGAVIWYSAQQPQALPARSMEDVFFF